MGLFPVAAAIMVAGTLYTYPDNFRAQKALIAAKYSGAQVTLAKDFKFGETNKAPEFLKKFPLGKVPAFEGSDGVLLTESNAIAYYVANDELRGGSDAAARAQVVQWMCMADNEILPAACTWVFPTLGIMQFNKNATERAKEDVKAAMKTLNDHLLTRTFLVGERLSLADIAVACTMLSLYKQVLEPAFRKPFVNVTRWFTTVINQPNVKAVLGQVNLCAKMAEFDAKNLPSSLARVTARRRRKRKRPSRNRRSPRRKRRRRRRKPSPKPTSQQSPRRRTRSRKCRKEASISRSGRGFTPTMTSQSPWLGSGNILITRIIPSGAGITSTMTRSLWCSCLVTSSEECSRDWTNSTKMPSPQCVCSDRTTTPPSAESGYSKAISSLSSWTITGRWTTPATTGESWTASLRSVRSWWTSTGSGRATMRRADLSIRAKYSSEEQD